MDVEQHAGRVRNHVSRPLVRMDIPAFSTSGRPLMIWGSDNSIAGTRVFIPEITNAEKAPSNAKAAAKTGEVPASGGEASPVSNRKEEAA